MALILVVDDEEPIRDILREALEGAGHRVVTANDGREALRVYHAQRPDVVITDIVMPRRSGIDLVLELSRLSPRPKVIAMSGVTGKDFLEAAREANVARAFVKPFDVRAVMRAVDELAGPAGA
jgi:CheY-like chemotaxis protein